MTDTTQNNTGAAGAGHSAQVDGGGAPEGAGGDDNVDNRQYVGFWARVGAYLLDTVIVFAPVILLPSLLFYGVEVLEADSNFEYNAVYDTFIAAILLSVVVAFWRWKGATPGKMIIGAKIVDEKTGELPSISQCLRRWSVFFLSGMSTGPLEPFLFPLFVLIAASIVWVAFDKKKRGLHDKLAKTVVIKVVKNKKQ